MTTPFRKSWDLVLFLFSPRATCYLPCVPVLGSTGANHVSPTSVEIGYLQALGRCPGSFPKGASGRGDKGRAKKGGSWSTGSVCSSCRSSCLPQSGLLLFPLNPSSPEAMGSHSQAGPSGHQASTEHVIANAATLLPREPGMSLPLSGPML